MRRRNSVVLNVACALLASSALAQSVVRPRTPSYSTRQAAPWSAPSNARDAARATGRHAEAVNLEAGIELRARMRDVQRQSQIAELSRTGDASALERFKAQVRAEERSDRLQDRREVDAYQRRLVDYELRSIDRLLAGDRLGDLSRALVAERRSELLARQRELEVDETLRTLEREVERRDAEASTSRRGLPR